MTFTSKKANFLRRSLSTAALACWVVSPLPTFAQNKYCDGLKSLLVSAKNNFSDMTGQMLTEFPNVVAYLPSKSTEPLQGTCRVFKFKSGGVIAGLNCSQVLAPQSAVPSLQTAAERVDLLYMVNVPIDGISGCVGSKPEALHEGPDQQNPHTDRHHWTWKGPADNRWAIVLEIEQALVGKPVSNGINESRLTTFIFSPSNSPSKSIVP